MYKFLVALIFVSMTAPVLAQEAVTLDVRRFNASISAASNATAKAIKPTIKASQTDTTVWFYFSTVKPTGSILDTIVNPVVWMTKSTDSMRAAIQVQYGVGVGDPYSAAPFTAFAIDSIAQNTPGSSYTAAARSMSVWHRKPAGANCIRLIVATGAAGNSFGTKRTYNVGVVVRNR